jgi:signal transduction histidine kinase
VRLRLATKFSATILGIFTLSLLSNMMALFVAWRVDKRLDEIARANVPSAGAAEEFRASLLEERGIHVTYLLDGRRPEWLKGLEQVESRFQAAMTVLRSTANLWGDEGLLERLEKTCAELDGRRKEAAALDSRGEKGKARELLLTEVNSPLFKTADELCVQMAAAADQRVRENTARAVRRVRQAAWVASVSGGLTFGLGGVLLWMFFKGIVIPLRGMVADAQLLHGSRLPELNRSEEDEMRTVGTYLRSLLSDVADTRSSLERSRTRLLVAEKLASVGKLAASVAHEIRNPLTAMKMWLFSLQDSVRGNPDTEHKLGIISEEINRLDRIIRDFLEFSRPPALRCRAQPVDAVLRQTLELLAAALDERKVCVVREPAPDLPSVMADAEQLKQVFVNLLINAADAMGAGGEIRVLTTAEKDLEGRGMVVVRICDAGPGMPEDVQARIFEPFFSTKETGTGLGLAIAARIMAAHDGLLVLESSSEKGTVFAVWTPIAEARTHGQDSCR